MLLVYITYFVGGNILGIAGVCHHEELAFLKITDIDLGTALLIKIPYNKTSKSRSFTVTGEYLIIIP